MTLIMIKYKYSGKSYIEWADAQMRYCGDFLLRLFRDMLRIHMIEEEIERRYSQDQMKTPIHPVIGQEAT